MAARRLPCAALAGLLLTVPAAAADELSVDGVIARSIAAQGGQESWDAVTSLVSSGTFSSFSAPTPFVLYAERPGLYRFEHHYSSFPMTFGFDGETAWWETTAFFSEASWPVEVPLHYRMQIFGDAVFGGALLDHRERGHRVELRGRTDLDGEEAFEVAVTLPWGAAETWYLDAESFLPLARMSMGADIDRPLERWSYFSDYREVGGLKLPHRIEIELGSRFQLMEIDRIEVNAEIDEKLFALRPHPAIERLGGLAGEWVVAVQSRLIPMMPWIPGESRSTIRSVDHGGLLAEELSYLAAGSPRHVRRWYSYDRFREVYRVTYADSLTSHVNVLEGDFGDDGRLVLTNVGTGTTWTSQGRAIHNRQVVYDLAADGFKVDWEISADGGQTWFTRAKFTYTRPQPD